MKRGKTMRLGEAIDLVKRDYERQAYRSVRSLTSHARQLVLVFGDRPLEEVTAAEIERAIDAQRHRGYSAATVNRQLSALSRAFRLAKRRGWRGEAPEIPKLREAPARQGFFEEDELARVLAELPQTYRLPVRFAAVTGWRMKSEVLALRLQDVDWSAREVRLPPGSTKNGEGRVFPFTVELEQVLREAWQRVARRRCKLTPCQPVFGYSNGAPIRSFPGHWRQACKVAGCEGRLIHDLRRTAVRNMERAGIPRSVAMKLTGHKTESVYRRYDIVSANDLRVAAARLEGK